MLMKNMKVYLVYYNEPRIIMIDLKCIINIENTNYDQISELSHLHTHICFSSVWKIYKRIWFEFFCEY